MEESPFVMSQRVLTPDRYLSLLIPPLSIHVKHEQSIRISKRLNLLMREVCKQRAKHVVWASLGIIRVSATDKCEMRN